MKKKLIVSFLIGLLFIQAYSQVPEKFNYQGILRNSSGELVENTSITVKISLLQGGTTGAVQYSESHTTSTNNYGQFAVQVGLGTLLSGSFSGIDWSNEIYLKTEVANPAGGTPVDMGTVQLISVPYALYAKNVENNDDADFNPLNEIQNLALTGDTLAISNGNSIVFPYDSSQWAVNGDMLYYNTGNVGVGSSNPLSKLEVKSTSTSGALFQVINANNDTVFAVYPDGVKVFVDASAKGNIGGFAVSGRTSNKAGESMEYFRVTPDSTRIYINEDSTKGNIGGFAVSGRTSAKGNTSDYLQVTKDSTRIYIAESATKGNIGGFAVSGRTSAKSGEINDYFNISGNQNAETLDSSEARIFWYPKKEAFLTGRVIVESPDSVGTNSMATGFESKAVGDYSQALGYQAIARGNNSTAIGINAKATRNSSFAFGDHAEANGIGSYAIGSIGRDWNGNATGKNTLASGYYAVAIGLGAQAIELGSFAFGIDVVSGDFASLATGYQSVASGYFSTAMGRQTTASGQHSVAMGYLSTASKYASTAMGEYTLANGDWSTAMGNLTEASGDFSTAMGVESTASGDASTAMNKSTASGNYSTSIGVYTTAQGTYSFAAGFYSKATGNSSASLGYYTTANGSYSVSMGNSTNAKGTSSAAFGSFTTATGSSSASMGYYTKALPYASLVIGQYNDTTCSINGATTWSGTDPVFVIGNGTSVSARANAFTVLQNGNTAIGHSVPTQMLDVNGNARFRAFAPTGNVPLYVDPTGTLTTSTSDIRLKTNIEYLNGGLGKVLKLKGIRYNWKKDPGGKRMIGFIAQEVEKVIPELVFTNPVDGYMGVNYAEMAAVLVEAVKELKTENDNLKNQLLEMNKRLEKLEK